MYLTHAKSFVVVAFVLLTHVLCAQTSSVSNPTSLKENNPYSKYGIGEFWNGNSTSIKAMGDITSGLQDPFLINSDNPASYASLVLTTFEGGATASTRKMTATNNSTYRSGTASIAYMNIGIPFNNKAGISLGLRPFSRTYYALADTLRAPNSPIGNAIRSYSGDGGLSYAYMGGAYTVKNFSLGFNVGYLFGNYRNYTAVLPIDTAAINRAYQSEFARLTRLGGLYWKAGFQYKKLLADSTMRIVVGGTLALNQKLNENLNYFQSATYGSISDTSFRSDERTGKLTLPTSFSLGATLSKTDKYSIGLEYTGANWTQYNSTPDSNFNLNINDRSQKISIGGSYTPNMADIRGYFTRVTYRLGAYYGTDYVKIGGSALQQYGITFGASFPYKRNTRSYSRLHTSFDMGKLGNTSNNGTQQTYFRFGLGFSFNEKWFIPRKYD